MRGNELPAIENSSLEPDKEKAAPLDRDAARVRLKELKKKLEG
jgi:hypothetical protein